MASAVLLLTTLSAVAHATSTEPTSDEGAACAVDPAPGDRGALELSWQRGTDGWTQPVLLARTPDVDDLSLVLLARIHFAGDELQWTTTPVDVPAYEEVEIGLGDLDDTAFDAEQADWLSDLSVTVVLVDADGDEVHRQVAPPLELAFDAYGALLLTPDEAEELSTGGAWSTAAEDIVGDPIASGDAEFDKRMQTPSSSRL